MSNTYAITIQIVILYSPILKQELISYNEILQNS